MKTREEILEKILEKIPKGENQTGSKGAYWNKRRYPYKRYLL